MSNSAQVLQLRSGDAALPASPLCPLLGTFADGGAPFPLDLDRLIATRMLVQAASGGGKSWALRRMLEQTHGHVQQIIIDPEGELVSLAEKFEFVVFAAESSDFPLHSDCGAQTADLIFRSGQSAIVSLAELEVEDMQIFVRDFIRALMRQPPESWKPILVVIDEAQLFAPQQDKAESKKALLDLAARGRKRGLCPVVATQRLSQLHKGVVAHLDNKLVGLTTLDVDVERAADQLGMRASDAKPILRRLTAGDFLAYGPALTYDITRVTVGSVTTRHGGVTLAGRPYIRSMSAVEVAAAMRQLVQVVEAARVAAEGSNAEPGSGNNDGAATSAMASDHRDEELLMRRIAAVRMEAIRPLLGRGRLKKGELQNRASFLDLAPHDLRNWLTRFDNETGARSLRPTVLQARMERQLCALEPILLGAS